MVRNLFLIWFGGCKVKTDAANEVTEESYTSSLQLMVSRINTELSAPPKRIVIGRISDHYDVPVSGAQIRAAQSAVAADAANNTTHLLDTDNYDMNNDDIHYSSKGLVDLGRDLYRFKRT